MRKFLNKGHTRGTLRKSALIAGLAGALTLPAIAAVDTPMFTPKRMTDWLHLVMSSDRTVYIRLIVNRLQNKEKVIKASEHFEDDKALVLPAQMFRFGAEMVGESTDDFSYSLLSEWPINPQNAPRTPVEKEGLAYIAANKGENFYATEELGGTKYFTAVYADTAVAPACVTCHNDHKDTPRSDFKIGDVMGGVVIRVPM